MDHQAFTPRDFGALVGEWVLVRDTEGVLESERRRFGTAARDCVCFVYVDHTAGISVHVEAFCERLAGDVLQVAARPSDRNEALRLRYDVLCRLPVAPLTAVQRKALVLPESPDWLHFYEVPSAEEVRCLVDLDPLRAPGFPDDIRCILTSLPGLGFPPDLSTEQVWVRTERLRERSPQGAFFVEGTLLNEPNQAFGIHRGNDVIVRIEPLPDGVSSLCLGLVSWMRA